MNFLRNLINSLNPAESEAHAKLLFFTWLPFWTIVILWILTHAEELNFGGPS